MIHIGIDTSNYKTSLAAVDDCGLIAANISEYLDVPKGERGLRQSDAFFKHSNRLPKQSEELFSNIDISQIASVGVSYAPRRVEGSYMPCFLSGVNLAKVISQILDIPYYEFSHQEGHAAAVIEGSGELSDEQIIFMHLSGGTTEFLKCRPDDKGYETEIVGGSLDISFGQLVDRFGVALGLPFPAGMHIDKLASAYKGGTLPKVLPNIRINDGYFNLSGPETRLIEFAHNNPVKCEGSEENLFLSISDNREISAVCFELMNRISDILIQSANSLVKEYGINKVYMAGGVASSEAIRKIINDKDKSGEYQIIFGDKELSGDNAVGIARLAARMFSKENNSRDKI